MKNLNVKIKTLYRLLTEAKEVQVDLTSNHGEEMTKAEREKVVIVWNSLDEAAKAAFELKQSRKA